MAAHAQHENIGAGTKNLFFCARHHYGTHLRVLEADAADGIVQLDVNAQVVAVELELVAGAKTGVFVKIRLQGGHRAIEIKFPVFVPGWGGLVFDSVGNAHGLLSLN